MNFDISFQDFLKKYSIIWNVFVDDFLQICINDSDNFIVDLDIIVKWISIKKEKLKKKLIKYFVKNKDYIIENKNEKQNNYGGNNKEILLLTPDCFKMLCMRINTNKCNEIRHERSEFC